MNSHDIELPPLPPLCIAPSVEPVDYPVVAQALMDYAREAIEPYAKRIAELESANAELERLCDETYVTQGAAAYNLACEEMEDWQAERCKAGKEVGTTGSLCDGIQWLYGYIEELEAELKRHDRMLAHEWIRPALRLEEDAPYRFDFYAQEIEKLRNGSDYRKRRGEPVPKGWKLVPETPTSKQIVHMACQIKGADADGWFRTDGDDWPEHVDAAERAYKWALSEAPQPLSESDIPAEPVKKKDWNVELSSWSEEDFVQVFHERPDLADRLRKILTEPVAADFPVKGKLHGPLGWIANNTNPEPEVKANAEASVPSENDLWPNGSVRYFCDRCSLTLGAEVVLEIAKDFNPTRPVEPTPAQIRRARLRTDPVKAAALDRAKERIAAELANSADPVKGPSDSAIMFEWSKTPNTGDMRVDLIAFARALLARYG